MEKDEIIAIKFLENVCTDDCVNKEFVVKPILNLIKELKKENKLLKHRLEVANEFIESRQEVLIPENYEDLKYILNECDLESTW